MAPAQECNAEVCEMSSLPREQVPDDSVRKRARHNIFLSHSGAQKDFVEQLCLDLERAALSPFFDKRRNCLPMGEDFAQLIFTAAQECEVAVVVMSDEYFFKTKWPMLELVAVVEAQRCKILPLFYKLTCKKFKEPKRKERWFQRWTEWAQSDPLNRIDLDAWKHALRKLEGVKGMEFFPEAVGEVGYREQIVSEIRSLMQLKPQDAVTDVEECASEGNQNPAQHPDAGQFQSISPMLLKWIMIIFFPFWLASLLELLMVKIVTVFVILYIALFTIIVPTVKEFIRFLESDNYLNLETESPRYRYRRQLA